MIDHISIAVRDLDRAARFYQEVLGAIGYEKLVVRPRTVGFGKSYPEFWLNLRTTMVSIETDSGAHAALRVRAIDLVDAFHAAALAAGLGSCRALAVPAGVHPPPPRRRRTVAHFSQRPRAVPPASPHRPSPTAFTGVFAGPCTPVPAFSSNSNQKPPLLPYSPRP